MFFRPRHPLELRAEEIAQQMQAKLTRMGFKHRRKMRDYDELYQVEWLELQVTPQFVKLRIDIDALPEGVTTARLKDDAVLTDLGHALGYSISFEDRDKKEGCWFVVHLGEFGGIPNHVPFETFMQSYPGGAPMMIPIGHGLHGPMWRDLRKMPHLLVAGATGRGKSVMMHAIIGTLVHLPPNRLRVVLADLKGGMTLGKYKKLPHLRKEHYVRQADRLPLLLLALQQEMQRRVDLMEDSAEDIDEWNRNRQEKWPYILVVIEELANAMLSKERIKMPNGRSETVAAATDRLLADLAARARAAGIHIVATTQSPRSDVINGLIKANFPSRIAFGTANDMDSRVIIDVSRAQGLHPGRMIYLDCADYYELQAPELTEEGRAKILKATLAGQHWLIAQNQEQRLVNRIRLLLDVAERDFANVLDLSELVRVPEIKKLRITPDQIKECITVMAVDGAIRKNFLRKTYTIAMQRAEWEAKYPEGEVLLTDWDAIREDKAEDYEDSIEVEFTEAKRTSREPLQLRSAGEFAELKEQIRHWHMMGYSRNEMKKRMGMDSTKAWNLIVETLGPAPRRTKQQDQAPC